MRRRRPHMRGDDGFTLLELMVVILIMMLVAGIATTTLLMQRAKAHDAEAKQVVGNLVRQLESCHADREDFLACVDVTELEQTGLAVGTGAGEVEVRDVARLSYVAVSHSSTGAVFRVHRAADGRFHSCTPPGEGGCRAGAVW